MYPVPLPEQVVVVGLPAGAVVVPPLSVMLTTTGDHVAVRKVPFSVATVSWFSKTTWSAWLRWMVAPAPNFMLYGIQVPAHTSFVFATAYLLQLPVAWVDTVTEKLHVALLFLASFAV